MDAYTTITLTLRDKTISALDLARWIKGVYPELTSQQYLAQARDLIAGKTWEPVFWNIRHYEDGPCDFVINDPSIDYWKNLQKTWDYHRDLLTRGAGGDTAAAIEYCKLELSGKISHGAMG